jgi:hypothetical protein
MYKETMKKKIVFVVIFAVLGFLALQVPLVQVVGSKAKFTLFDSFAPIAGAFLGSIPGMIAVLLMQLGNFFVHGAEVVDAGTIIRFFPALFAAMYFARKTKFNLAIPLLAILAFNIHPIGRSVWYYSLFWLIPVACYFWQEKFLLARSLGATFTAHAVGGAAWIWAFSLPKAVWISLIPVVAVERIIFALGMAVTYVLVNNILAVLEQKNIVSLPINRSLVWSKLTTRHQ